MCVEKIDINQSIKEYNRQKKLLKTQEEKNEFLKQVNEALENSGFQLSPNPDNEDDENIAVFNGRINRINCYGIVNDGVNGEQKLMFNSGRLLKPIRDIPNTKVNIGGENFNLINGFSLEYIPKEKERYGLDKVIWKIKTTLKDIQDKSYYKQLEKVRLKSDD